MGDFHDDPFYVGGGHADQRQRRRPANDHDDHGDHDDDGGRLAAFMRRKERHRSGHVPQKQQQQQQQPQGSGSRRHASANSPGSLHFPLDDGMTQASRRKHDNYARVVREMKTRGGGGGGRQPQQRGGQQQQQQFSGGGQKYHDPQRRQNQQMKQYHGQQQFGQPQQQWQGGGWPQQQQQRQQQPPQGGEAGWGFDAGFGNNDDEGGYFDHQPQPRHSQQQHSQQHPQPNIAAAPPPARPGRSRLYKDPSDPSTSRSRSTVRRTADRTQRLAVAYTHLKHQRSAEGGENVDDGMSDVGSVASLGGSDVFGGFGSFGSHNAAGGSFYASGSGSGEGLGPPPSSSRRQQHRRHPSLGSTGSADSRSRRDQSLHSFVGRTAASPNGGGREEESVAGVASGAGGAAARRRAGSRSRKSGSTNSLGSPPTSNKGTGNMQRGTPPPSSGNSVASGNSSSTPAGNARSRMRARMQASSSSPRTSFSSPGNESRSSTPIKHAQPAPQRMHHGGSPPRPVQKTAVSQATRATTAALSHAPAPDLGPVALASDALDEEVDLALSELKISHPDISIDFGAFGRMDSGSAATASAGGGSGSVGSVGSSVGGSSVPSGAAAGRLPSFPHGKPKGVGGGGARGWGKGKGGTSGGRTSPHTVSTKSLTVDPSLTTTSPTEPPSSAELAPVISVEQYSESSSLTDDVASAEWPWHGGSSGGRAAGNIFKDPKTGSTFHKSKKIVRPGEAVPRSPRIAEHGAAATNEAEDTANSSSSVRDRISQFRGGSAPVATPRQSAARPAWAQPEEGPPPQPQSPENDAPPSPSSVRNSPFRRNDPSSSTPRENRLPPTAPPPASSSSSPSNPFAVKLRKTRPAPQAQSPSLDAGKDTIDSHFGDRSSPAAARGADRHRDSVEDGNAAAPESPFQVRLRKTGGVVVPKANDAQRYEGPEHDAVDAAPQSQAVEEEAPKRKLTWREKQELLKREQEQQQQQQQSGVTDEAEEAPKKDVAALIRERIAASKQNGGVQPSPAASSGGGAATDWRSGLKKTPPRPSPVKTNLAPSPSNDDAKGALNAMFAKRGDSPVVEGESEKEKEEADPRASLMAMLNKRGATPPSSSKTGPKLGGSSSASPDPNANLNAMLQKRLTPPTTPSRGPATPKEEEEGDRPDPRDALSAMLAKRTPSPAAKAGGGEEKNAALSAMLASRASPQQAASPSPGTPSGGDGRPALKHDPKYEKYFKMLKVGMPMPAVQHAMTRDGLDPSVMDGDHNQPAPLEGGGGVPLKEDPTYAKYFKMLKLGLAMGAVKNAMERDGMDPSVMDGDHNAPVNAANGAGGVVTPSSKTKRQKDTHRRTRLHWDTLGEVNENSVWAMVEEDEELEQIEIDENEFATLFQAEIKATGANPASMGARGGGGGKNVVQVIDPKRANNGGIILARLRMSYDDMAIAVDTIDETAMTSNQAQGIIEYMPTSVERKSLREYMTGTGGESADKFDKLCECEKFMVAMMTVKQSKKKLKALLFKLQFRGCIHDLAHDVICIEKACDELTHSVRLRKLFGIVLNIGNRLNTAGPGQKRKAGAFTIRSLLKLNQAKAFDNKTTFLHYVVLVVQRNSEALLDFKDDLPTVSKADKIFWDQCVGELEEVETQLENVRKLALHEAKSSKVMYQLPNKKGGQEDVDSDDLSVESMSLEDEVALLRSTKIGMFALSAIRKVSQLRERVDTSKEKFSNLLEYLGETRDSKMQPHELFEIITTFCRNFDVARGEVERMEKAKKRDEKKDKGESKAAKNEKLKSICETPSPAKKSPSLPRASSLQPNMGNVLSDLKRATSGKFPPLKPGSTPPVKGSGPPNVTPRYPDDESSGFGSTVSNGSSRRASSPQLVQSQAAAARASEETNERARAQARAVEASHAAKEAEERRRAEEAAAAEEAAWRASEERRLAEEAARHNMEERRRAEETAAAEEAAWRASEEKRHAEEARRRKMEERRLAEEAAAAAEEAAAARRRATGERRRAEEAARASMQQHQHEEEAVPSQSYESEADGPTGRASEGTASASHNRRARREMMSARRERARNRHFRPTTSPTKSPPPSTAAEPPRPAVPAQARKEERAPTSNTSPNPKPSSQSSARASARDRYARHKKMLQQRHAT